MGYVLAFDVGTTAIKAVIVDRKTKKTFEAKEGCSLYRPAPDMAEQDADELWESLCEASRKAVKKAGISPCDVEAVVISAPWKHIIPLSESGKPIRRSLIWMDARAAEQAQRLNSAMGEFVGTGQEYWPRLMWLMENEPETWAGAKRISGLNTYFKLKATGEFYTEPSDDFIHSPNKALQKYYDKILDHAGLTPYKAKFAPCKASYEQAGALTESAADEMGLTKGIPVFGGFGDLVAIPYGCGCTKPGDTHIYLGTSSWQAEIFTDRIPGTGNLFYTQDIGLEAALCSLQTVGKAYDWAIDTFYPGKREKLGEGVYQLVNDEISDIPAGSDRLIATHWLNGELPPLAKNAKALFFNIDEHHDRRYFVRAILESICYTHRTGFENFCERNGRPESIKVAGGGALNPAWMQIMADVLKVRIDIPKNPRFAGTMGSYYCAEIGLGAIKEYPRDITIEKRYIPNPENFAVYDKMYGIYCSLYPALKEAYDKINS